MPGKWGGVRRARPPLDPPMVRSKLNKFEHIGGGVPVQKGSCVVTSNASWVMVTWEPLPPVNRMTGRHD